jgi:hypothetical protein
VSKEHRAPTARQLRDELRYLARAAVDYDEAIMAAAADPSRLTEYRTVQGDDLDALYFRLMVRARTLLGLPNVLRVTRRSGGAQADDLGAFEPQPATASRWVHPPPKEEEVT